MTGIHFFFFGKHVYKSRQSLPELDDIFSNSGRSFIQMQGSGVGSEGSRLEARMKSHKSAVAIT